MKFILYLTITIAFTIIAIISLIGCLSIIYKVLEGNYEETSVNIALLVTYGIAGPILTIEYVAKAWKKLLSKE